MSAKNPPENPPEKRSPENRPSSDSREAAAKPSPSVWNFKPWWCQPWSIVLTGLGAIALSWFFFHRLWLTGLVAVPMLTWMGFFLILFPKAAAESGLLEQMQRDHAGTNETA